jgi:predicted nucleic acid-binding protein
MTLSGILDTTVLSNFAHAQRPDLVRQALGEGIATTPAVMSELETGEARGLIPACDWSWLAVLELTDEERKSAAELSRRHLDPGEAECLAVAQIRNCKFFSDDFAARRLAGQRDLKVSGTLGILLTLVHRDTLTLAGADAVLSTAILHSYLSPVKSLRELLP